LIKCQRTVGKEATKFLLAKDKALRKCRKLVDKGDLAGPCPDGPATNPDGSFAKTAQGAIAKSESRPPDIGGVGSVRFSAIGTVMEGDPQAAG